MVSNIFDVYKCNLKGGYKYYIDSPEKLKGNTHRCWLTTFAQAIGIGRLVEITHQGTRRSS